MVVGKKLYDGPEFSEAVDLTGKTIIITGANTGLGKEAALRLSGLGKPEVLLLCRDRTKATEAIKFISQETGNPNIRFVECDLADLKSVSRAADQIKTMVQKIDVLQLNSGVMAIPTREVTTDGFEKHMGINHLGHFALARDLFPLVKKADGGRIVTVRRSHCRL